MAKIHHNNYQDTIQDLIKDGERRGILHLSTTEDEYGGRHMNIGGQDMLNFGTCGYLGLEIDDRLRTGAAEYAMRYGTQFSVSRTYLASGINYELERLLQKIYNKPLIVYSSTSSAHISVIPSLVKDKDAIILDQQVHMSVQTGAQLMSARGVPVEMIRHSNLEMLERKLKEWGNRYEKVWYLIDGVYSMFGDVAPIHELVKLTEQYPALHLYIDDAHGMSWYGPNGGGYIFGEVGVLPKMMLITTLAKGFGVTGGIAIFPDEESYQKVNRFGGPLTYSHPIAPPLLGASLASAHIHLSPEMEGLQKELRSRIEYCNMLLDKTSLPVISDRLTPIYFIGAGQPKVGYNLVKRLLNDGIYINIGLFPAVPIKNTGLRFTLTRHVELEDIRALVQALEHHYPKALEEEGRTENEVRRAFRLPLLKDESEGAIAKKQAEQKIPDYVIQHETSIENIDRSEWNRLLEMNGAFSYDAIKFMEKAFSGGDKPENKWNFHYYIVRDKDNKPLLATFLTVGLFKDDLVAPASVSMMLEDKRQNNPYYLVSETVSMGSLITEGKHLYIDRAHPYWREIFRLLLEEISLLQEQSGAANVLLRDFEADDLEIKNFLMEEGFVKLDLPHANVIEGMEWNTVDEFLETLSAKRRSHIRTDVLRYSDRFTVEIKDTLSPEEAAHFYDLYLQVKSRNFAINYFPYPEKLFNTISGMPGWEFIIVKLKNGPDGRAVDMPVSIGACFKTEKTYSPLLLGMDYRFVYDHKVYKQSLFQVLLRARQLKLGKIFFGFSADTDKRKFGAIQIPRVAYLQAKDNFNFEMMEAMAMNTASLVNNNIGNPAS